MIPVVSGLEHGDLMALALAIPALAVLGILVRGGAPNQREAVTLIAALALFAVVLELFLAVGAGARPSLLIAEVTDGLSIRLELEPLGALFALLASGLWFVNSLYSIGYMRGGGESNQTRFYAYFAVAIFAAMGVAMAADLFTLFLFYEVLTLSTYPLVAHKGDEKARRGARIYLGILLGVSLAFFLPAIILVNAAAGGLDFTVGGLLPDLAGPAAGAGPLISSAMYGVMLVLFAFGVGKAALMPVHPWLPNAMVAPTPVSALLHAVAVVKAGVFTMLKISVYVFGSDVMQVLPAADALAWIAAISIVLASLIAWTKDNLKARLAFSTVSQLAYITLAAMLATPAALMGGALQLVFHAFGKITLFMTAGGIYVGAKRTEISSLNGLARAMPWTFAAFAVGAASVIGLPPLAGVWPKLFLMEGAWTAGQGVLIGALVLSSLLNVAYLAPIAGRGALLPPDGRDADVGAPVLAVLPPVITAFGCVILFFCAGYLMDYLAPVFIPAEAAP